MPGQDRSKVVLPGRGADPRAVSVRTPSRSKSHASISNKVRLRLAEEPLDPRSRSRSSVAPPTSNGRDNSYRIALERASVRIAGLPWTDHRFHSSTRHQVAVELLELRLTFLYLGECVLLERLHSRRRRRPGQSWLGLYASNDEHPEFVVHDHDLVDGQPPQVTGAPTLFTPFGPVDACSVGTRVLKGPTSPNSSSSSSGLATRPTCMRGHRRRSKRWATTH